MQTLCIRLSFIKHGGFKYKLIELNKIHKLTRRPGSWPFTDFRHVNYNRNKIIQLM